MLHKATSTLVVVGALNWGLIGLFNFNLVSAIFGPWPMIEKLIYIFVGLSAIYEVMSHSANCRECYDGMSKGKK